MPQSFSISSYAGTKNAEKLRRVRGALDVLMGKEGGILSHSVNSNYSEVPPCLVWPWLSLI